MRSLLLLVSLALLGLSIFVEPARAANATFECPRTFTPSSQAKRQEVQRLLPEGDPLDDVDRLNATIDALRHNGLSRSQIINHLIGAFCPVVAQNTSLSDAEKAEHVRLFAGKIAALVSSYENETRIIIDVPLKPGVVDAVTTMAHKDGVSVGDWIARSVEAGLRQQ
jgi:hypothetical protein